MTGGNCRICLSVFTLLRDFSLWKQRGNMQKLLVLAVSLLLWIPAALCLVTTSGERTALEGQSVTILCPYEPQYADYVKYWCQGKKRETCSSLARTDDTPSENPTEDKVSLKDDRVQQGFTVTLIDLKEADTGWYMCAVEVGGFWTVDVVEYVYINVIHGWAVETNQVVGEEGGGVTVECLYSERLRENDKQWCRSGDLSSCRQPGPEGIYEDASVAIRDDGTRAFTVTLKKLRQSDSGWYWCFAGHQKLAVEVRVTPRPTTMSATTLLTSSRSQSDAQLPPPSHIEALRRHWPVEQAVMVCCVVLVLVVMATLGRFWWKTHRPYHPPLDQHLGLEKV